MRVKNLKPFSPPFSLEKKNSKKCEYSGVKMVEN
jgi:hypothetical protein